MSTSALHLMCGALMLLPTACGGRARAPHAIEESRESTMHWRVDRPTTTAEGGDIDDAQPEIALVSEGAGATTINAGGGVGICETDPPADIASVCGASPTGLVTRLVCGRDPHVDRVICFDVVRTSDRVALWRREYDVPSVDGTPPPPRLVTRTKSGGFELPRECVVRIAPTIRRDVVEK